MGKSTWAKYLTLHNVNHYHVQTMDKLEFTYPIVANVTLNCIEMQSGVVEEVSPRCQKSWISTFHGHHH